MITYALTVANESGRDLPGVQIRSIVPDLFGSFIGLITGSICTNATSNCYPGMGISWISARCPRMPAGPY